MMKNKVKEQVKPSEVHKGYILLENAKEIIYTHSISEDFVVEETPFARGKFAAVRRVKCRTSGRWFAAKVIRRRRRAHDVRHEALHEAAVLSLARQCHLIVGLRAIFESISEVILVLELAEGGELQSVIDAEGSLEEIHVRRYLTEALKALRFLHSHNIAHLDLKPQNLLLTGNHPEGDLRLCDFGLARNVVPGIDLREILGTTDYVAPEVLHYEPLTLASDMWSVGILAYVLLTGYSPFAGDTKQETFLNISRAELDFPKDLFGDVSPEAQDFISRLIVLSPSRRLTVDQCFSHPWLSGSLSSPRAIVTSVVDEHQRKRKASDSSPPHSLVAADEKENRRNAINGTAPPRHKRCELASSKDVVSLKFKSSENGVVC